MELTLLKLAFVFFPFLFTTGNDTWKVQSSEILFSIKYAGSIVTGTFSGLNAEIRFDPSKPENASIKASVDVKTIETGIGLRNRDLRSNFFEEETYPKIKMESTKIEKTGTDSYLGTFNLTMKNVTKEIKLPFIFMKTPEKTEFKGSFSLNRLDYGVGRNRLSMSDKVDIGIIVVVSENLVSAQK